MCGLSINVMMKITLAGPSIYAAFILNKSSADLATYVTGFGKTDHVTIDISRNTDLKY